MYVVVEQAEEEKSQRADHMANGQGRPAKPDQVADADEVNTKQDTENGKHDAEGGA